MAEAKYDESGEEREKTPRETQLQALEELMSGYRKEAYDGRKETEIEDEWLVDEEFYEGIDDLNRGEVNGNWRTKPPGQASLGDEGEGGRHRGSTVFFNLTRAYTDAASARVGDMLLPTDDKAWSIKPTPVPELAEVAKANLTGAERQRIETDTGAGTPESKAEMAKVIRGRFPSDVRRKIDNSFAENDPQQQRARDQTYLDAADEMSAEMEEATKKASAAEKRIEDWHVQNQYHTEMRKVIDSSSRIGTGVMKGPMPKQSRELAFDADAGKVLVSDSVVPWSYSVDPWNCFPDPACGESIHDGQYHWERADILPRRLDELRNDPGYLPQQIDMVLSEGPQRFTKQGDGGKEQLEGAKRRDRKRAFEIWYGYTFVPKGDIEALNMDIAGIADDQAPPDILEQNFIPLAVTMVNNSIIKVALNHLDNGAFPYDYMVWQPRADMPWGMGVPRQGHTAQRVINASARNMMDNAGLSGGPMWSYIEGLIEPLDGVYEIRPRKGWAIPKEALQGLDPRVVEQAFQFHNVESLQSELKAILDIGMKLFEDSTGLPMLLQGQLGTAPDTVGGMTMLQNNASSVMRRIAKLFDDRVTEPHIRRYYDYLLQYGEDAEKGDFQIDARGSSALVERDMNNQALQALGQFVTDPRFKKDPAKWLDEWMRSQKLDPRKLDYDDEQWKEIVEGLAQQQQQGDSSVEVAGIRAQSAAEVQMLRNESQDKDRELETAKLALEEERAAGEASLQEQREESQRQMEVAFKTLEDELDKLKLNEKREAQLVDVKARLSETMMKLRQQEKLSLNKAGGEALPAPTEPAGRAPDGQAFSR